MMYDVYRAKPREIRAMRILESTTKEEIYAFLSLHSQYAPNHENFRLDVEYCHHFSKCVDEPITMVSQNLQTLEEISQHFYDESGTECSVVPGKVGDYLVFLDDGRCRIFTEEELKKDYDYSSTQPFS